MKRLLTTVCIAAVGVFVATAAMAHAHLNHAVPGIDATVKMEPSELELTFTQDLTLAFSGVSLKGPDGKPVPIDKPSAGPANTLHVKLMQKLAPGKYTVSWHATSIDTHRTQGTYHFTVAP